eukprot:IDg21359t1
MGEPTAIRFTRTAGLCYEGAVSLAGDIVSVIGQYPYGSQPDFLIFCDHLKHALLPGEMALAGKGYTDECCALPFSVPPTER